MGKMSYFKKWLQSFVVVGFVVGFGYLVQKGEVKATYHSTARGALKNCGNCHSQSLLQGHGQEHFQVTHGKVARQERGICHSCHEEQQCRTCHERVSPEWEKESVRSPGDSVEYRTKHAEISRQHRDSCMECHGPHFQTQCSKCHTQEEGWTK